MAGNFWPRTLDLERFPVSAKLYRTAPGVEVLVHSHRPAGPSRGEIIFVHGLEGSSDAGYIRSMSQAALEAGFGVHRFNLRSCGGTESLSETMYHSGLTIDVLTVAKQLAAPVYLVGFSLGGNVVLKLAGELGASAEGLFAGVCAVSTPIDLAACVERLGARENLIYAWRFVDRLKKRVELKSKLDPVRYSPQGLDRVSTVFQFDDRYTAPLFGFDGADHYYRTQSAKQFLGQIAVPTLLVQARNDPLVPFSVYDDPVVTSNPLLRLVAPEHGGHLGFIARDKPRFWLDGVVLEFLEQISSQTRHSIKHESQRFLG